MMARVALFRPEDRALAVSLYRFWYSVLRTQRSVYRPKRAAYWLTLYELGTPRWAPFALSQALSEGVSTDVIG